MNEFWEDFDNDWDYRSPTLYGNDFFVFVFSLKVIDRNQSVIDYVGDLIIFDHERLFLLR